MAEFARVSSLPLPAMIGAATLIGFSVLAVSIGRSESVGLTALPEADAVSSVAFRVTDGTDGAITLSDARDDRLLLTVQPGEGSFIRATLRGLAQARHRSGLGRETPFVLTRYDNGTLSLDDSATGRRIALEAFGRPNALAFARLLPGGNGLTP